jgi:cbb3-type cytochrome oxidase subunit 3
MGVTMTGIVVVWLALAVFVGVFASNKGRNGFLGFLLALILSPLIGFIWVALMRDKKAEARHSELVKAVALKSPPEADTRVCPRCAETIKAAAKVCRFCQAELEPVVTAPPPWAVGAAPQPVAPPAAPPKSSLATSLAFLTFLTIFVIAGALSMLGSSPRANTAMASASTSSAACNGYASAFAQWQREVRESPEGAQGASFKMQEVIGAVGAGPMQLLMSFNAPSDRLPHTHYRVRGYADPSTCALQRWEIYERDRWG